VEKPMISRLMGAVRAVLAIVTLAGAVNMGAATAVAAADDARLVLIISGIDCASCHITARSAVANVDGVHDIKIRPTRDPSVLSAIVVYDPDVAGFEDMKAALARLGYEAVLEG